jgi:hypothetical protein
LAQWKPRQPAPTPLKTIQTAMSMTVVGGPNERGFSLTFALLELRWASDRRWM